MPPQPVLLGQYRPLDSFLHKLDARAKIVPITLTLVLALFTRSMMFYVAAEVILVASLLFSGISAATLARNFRPIVMLVTITALYHIIFSGGDSQVLWQWQGLAVRELAVEQALFFSLRLLLFVSIAFLMTLTSSPSELAEAFGRLVSPLRFLKVPVADLGLIVFMAIRFVPVLYEEFVAIRNAQTIRGVRFTGSLVNRVKKTSAIIIPVFVSAVQRADDLALALTARGYRSDVRRTVYTTSRFGGREVGFCVGSSLALAALFVVTR
jgi:energy-coupling factor transport system permease protein